MPPSPRRAPANPLAADYGRDFVAWTQDQADALRQRGQGAHASALDYDNLAEEIESLGRADRRSLGSHVRIVVEHLMKLEASPAQAPKKRWQDSIDTARVEIDALLEQSPSLRADLPAVIRRQTEIARRLVIRSLSRHAETPLTDLADLNYTVEQIVGDWFPPN